MHEADAQQVQAFGEPFGRLSTGSGRDRSHRRLGQQWRRDPPLSAATDMPVILRDAGLTLRSGVFHAIVSLRAASCGDPRHCIRRSADLRSCAPARPTRSEEHTSELQSLMRISYAVFCLKKKITL